MAMSDELEILVSEISRLRQEAAAVARMPPTVAERFSQIETELRQAEQLYRTHGLSVAAGHPAETAHLQRQVLIGAMMVIDPAKILRVERDRIAAAGEGMTAADKAKRLAHLESAIERTANKVELLLREREAPGEFLPRPEGYAHLAVFRQADVERLAATPS
jgi:hypothetical protein